MEKVIETYNYGLCVFSIDTMKQFLSRKKIRSKRVLALLQKKKDLFLDSMKDGVWVPIPSINSGEYVISVDGYDDPFQDEWTEVMSYEGFNLDVKNGFWVSCIGTLLNFDATEEWNKGLYGVKSYSDYWYDVPDGKYLLTISGFARKEIVDNKAANYGFRLELKKVDTFTDCKNPREEEYDFNVRWVHVSKPAVVNWLPPKESGICWPLKAREHKNEIIIPLENNKVAPLTIVFDLSNQTEKYVNKCRAEIHAWNKSEIPKDFELESGKEYPIMERTYKRDKTILKKLGTIKID